MNKKIKLIDVWRGGVKLKRGKDFTFNGHYIKMKPLKITGKHRVEGIKFQYEYTSLKGSYTAIRSKTESTTSTKDNGEVWAVKAITWKD